MAPRPHDSLALKAIEENVLLYNECELCCGLFPRDMIQMHVKVGHENEKLEVETIAKLRLFACTEVPEDKFVIKSATDANNEDALECGADYVSSVGTSSDLGESEDDQQSDWSPRTRPVKRPRSSSHQKSPTMRKKRKRFAAATAQNGNGAFNVETNALDSLVAVDKLPTAFATTLLGSTTSSSLRLRTRVCTEEDMTDWVHEYERASGSTWVPNPTGIESPSSGVHRSYMCRHGVSDDTSAMYKGCQAQIRFKHRHEGWCEVELDTRHSHAVDELDLGDGFPVVPSIYSTKFVGRKGDAHILHANCTTVNELREWVQEYKRVSGVKWYFNNESRPLPHVTDPEILYSRYMVCAHSYKARHIKGAQDYGCGARIKLSLKREGYCEITLRSDHTHEIEWNEPGVSFRKASVETGGDPRIISENMTRSKLHSYFVNGLDDIQARARLEEDIRASVHFKEGMLTDTSLLPSARNVKEFYRLFKIDQKQGKVSRVYVPKPRKPNPKPFYQTVEKDELSTLIGEIIENPCEAPVQDTDDNKTTTTTVTQTGDCLVETYPRLYDTKLMHRVGTTLVLNAKMTDVNQLRVWVNEHTRLTGIHWHRSDDHRPAGHIDTPILYTRYMVCACGPKSHKYVKDAIDYGCEARCTMRVKRDGFCEVRLDTIHTHDPRVTILPETKAKLETFFAAGLTHVEARRRLEAEIRLREDYKASMLKETSLLPSPKICWQLHKDFMKQCAKRGQVPTFASRRRRVPTHANQYAPRDDPMLSQMIDQILDGFNEPGASVITDPNKLRLVDHPEIPSSYGTKLVGVLNSVLLLHADINCPEQMKLWMQEYSSKSRAVWLLAKQYPSKPACRKGGAEIENALHTRYYVCRNATGVFLRKEGCPLNLNCPAIIRLQMKKEGHCEIVLKADHNHARHQHSNKKINPETVDKILACFRAGMDAAQAKLHIELELRARPDFTDDMITDSSMLPGQMKFLRLYNDFLKENPDKRKVMRDYRPTNFTADSLEKEARLLILQETARQFQDYYKSGLLPKAALAHHEKILRQRSDFKPEMLLDEIYLPKYRKAKLFYEQYKKVKARMEQKSKQSELDDSYIPELEDESILIGDYAAAFDLKLLDASKTTTTANV